MFAAVHGGDLERPVLSVRRTGALEGLIEVIEGLADDGVPNGGQAHALIVKLEGVLENLAIGATTTILDQPAAFRNQIEAFVQPGVLTVDQGQPLLNAVDAALEALGG